jgi:hypothetical protein
VETTATQYKRALKLLRKADESKPPSAPPPAVGKPPPRMPAPDSARGRHERREAERGAEAVARKAEKEGRLRALTEEERVALLIELRAMARQLGKLRKPGD